MDEDVMNDKAYVCNYLQEQDYKDLTCTQGCVTVQEMLSVTVQYSKECCHSSSTRCYPFQC